VCRWGETLKRLWGEMSSVGRIVHGANWTVRGKKVLTLEIPSFRQKTSNNLEKSINDTFALSHEIICAVLEV